MEKTQSISIIDNFASVDDPRMERAGKRKLGGAISGILSNDAFGRVFSFIDERSFQGIFIEWTKRVWEAAQGQVAAIDGKTVQRSADRAKGKSPIHMAGRVLRLGGEAEEGGLGFGAPASDAPTRSIKMRLPRNGRKQSFHILELLCYNHFSQDILAHQRRSKHAFDHRVDG